MVTGRQGVEFGTLPEEIRAALALLATDHGEKCGPGWTEPLVPPGAVEKLASHAAEMLRWNRAIRLTAITDIREVAVKHILDSLLPLRLGPFSGGILDVGSGAGYPGLPLAVCLPECRVTLVEASAKKCAFLSRAVALLSLGNVRVIHGRVGKRGGISLPREDTVLSRATFPLPEAVFLLSPLVAPGGRLLLLAGSEGGAGQDGGGSEAGPLLPRRTMTLSLPYGMGNRTIRELVAP